MDFMEVFPFLSGHSTIWVTGGGEDAFLSTLRFISLTTFLGSVFPLVFIIYTPSVGVYILQSAHPKAYAGAQYG